MPQGSAAAERMASLRRGETFHRMSFHLSLQRSFDGLFPREQSVFRTPLLSSCPSGRHERRTEAKHNHRFAVQFSAFLVNAD